MTETQLFPAVIVSGYGGFYQARLADGSQLECKARGRLRQGGGIVIGDEALVSRQDAAHGMLERLVPRRNQLSRPRIANIDQAVIVLAWRLPDYDLLLLDNLLLGCRLAGVRPLLVFNKIDLLQAPEAETLNSICRAYAAADCPALPLSVRQDPDLSLLLPWLAGKRSVLTGPSGVGKSSLLNLLLPQQQAETGEVSQRLQRGKHTTRYVRLLPLDESGGMVADTPGFFVLDTPRELTAQRLPLLYPEFSRLAAQEGGCRFEGCRHHREPECRVRQAVAEGRLDQGRYERYVRILEEILQREVKY